MNNTSSLTATGAQMLSDEQPPQRPDFEGQNIEAVRFQMARRIRELVDSLNREMKDAHTAGLTVVLNSSSMLNPDASNYAYVSIFERRRY